MRVVRVAPRVAMAVTADPVFVVPLRAEALTLSGLVRKFVNVSRAYAAAASAFSSSRAISLARSARVNFHSNGLARPS